ncbi:MAG: deoxyribodipyrimidine photo-lyase [Desulfobacca sp.]|nr:deoxyribodipyrimidine photo-lyase [Desulfobacca sp.]
MDPRRVRALNPVGLKSGPVVYWMSRDQRADDNWALLFSQEQALKQSAPLLVVFCLVPDFLNATLRQYSFMIHGLRGVEQRLRQQRIPFYLITGEPRRAIPEFVNHYRAGLLITDFDPLRLKRQWQAALADRLNISFLEVDAHNIVPAWVASTKAEYGAYTLRPKLLRALPGFLTDFPPLTEHSIAPPEDRAEIDWPQVLSKLPIDRQVQEVTWLKPGAPAAHQVWEDFLQHRLSDYDRNRNDPNRGGQSNLSPYLHFGQISAQRLALETEARAPEGRSKAAFLEELIVRRELADNFCLYNPHYDAVAGFPDWAQKTLMAHQDDPREYLYSLEEFETGQTHDDLWNAAQQEMVNTGKMHGYLRMYWAKKILEWTESVDQALKIAIYLNDKYELDGRDPNGYTGIAWSLGGVHDRAWPERPIFGKIRYMSYNGCKTKFDVKSYISKQLAA